MTETHGSLGAIRVREAFNPSGTSTVDKIKRCHVGS
jgi:hypothetical protein